MQRVTQADKDEKLSTETQIETQRKRDMRERNPSKALSSPPSLSETLRYRFCRLGPPGKKYDHWNLWEVRAIGSLGQQAAILLWFLAFGDANPGLHQI